MPAFGPPSLLHDSFSGRYRHRSPLRIWGWRRDPVAHLYDRCCRLTANHGSDRGINLLYFLPTAALALPAHVKNGFIEKRLLFPSVLSGLIGTALAAYVATALEGALLHRFFGFFLILVGISELFQNPKRKNEMDRRN